MLEAPFRGKWELFKKSPPATGFIEAPGVGTVTGDVDKVELIAGINVGRDGFGVAGDDRNGGFKCWLLFVVEEGQELLALSTVLE